MQRMDINIILMVAGIVLLGDIDFTEGQTCGDYVLITDSRRTTQFVLNTATDPPISDEDIDPSKWYRFRSYVGNSIPERAEGQSVPMNRCGTTYPMFISGLDQHPTIDGETRTATVRVEHWQGTITIHRCPQDENGDNFYIYLLVPAPADQTAYCAGEGFPCPDGQMFNGIKCVDYFPMMKSTPTFSGPHTTGINEFQQIYFKCQVHYDRVPEDSFARFMIIFIFDGLEMEGIEPPHKQLPPFTVGPEGDISAQLTEYYLQGRLGKEIQCKVRTFWEENSEKSTAVLSLEKYKATLEAVEIYDFDQTNGAEQRIPFHPTIPFTNYHCATHECPLPFIYDFFLRTDVATEMDCTLKWKNGTAPELAVYIKPFAGSRLFEIKFKPYDGDYFQEYSSLWNNFIIPTVTIRAFQSTEKLCSSMGDPHISNFDGRYFDAYLSGDYYMVLADADPYKLEVQVRHEACGGAACNCGVIVRELNSMVKISYDVCGEADSPTARPISVTRLLAQQPNDGTVVTRDDVGRYFSIRMPSGTRVEVDATVPYFNVQVHLAPIYHGKTSINSLCGNSNGNPDDDSLNFQTANITDPARNYFYTLPDCSEDYFPAAKTCACSESATVVECSNVEQNITMKSPANTELTVMWTSGIICVAPESSSLDQGNSGVNGDWVRDPADLCPPFVHDPNAGHNLSLTWPTPKGRTKEEVEQFCMNLLTASPVYSDCNTVANINQTLQNCVSDTQILDEYVATTCYASAFGLECVNILIAKENTNSTGGSAPPALDIHSKICPAQCSGHGTCTNATCICYAGFIGADCSVDETQPPVLTQVARSGICDIQERPCSTVSVFGHSIISSETLKCRFSDMGSGSALYTIGTLMTSSEVSCAVPNTTTERPAILRQGISVANDGTLYSNALEFLTFDSLCMTCGEDKVCLQKTDSCLISDRCYADGAMKDAQTCQQCSPSQSISSWTERPVIETLQPCSRTCDYGAQIKETVCTVNNAVIKTEPVLCKTSTCTAIPEENLQGVIMTVSNEDTAKILLTPTDILSQVAQVVNSYCSAQVTQCCNSVGVSNGVSLSSFTSLELCPYGSGYPQVGDTYSRIKVIVKIIPSEVKNECLQSPPQHSAVGEEIFADANIIVTAVSEGKTVIEQALNITIASVEKDNGDDVVSISAMQLPVAKQTLILATTVAALALIRFVHSFLQQH